MRISPINFNQNLQTSNNKNKSNVSFGEKIGPIVGLRLQKLCGGIKNFEFAYSAEQINTAIKFNIGEKAYHFDSGLRYLRSKGKNISS